MKAVRIVSRILIGIVFIFSGFVKSVDPLGTTYKFIDYFDAFHISFLADLALPFAIAQNVLEIIIGINLLFGLRMKITSWVLLIFMSFYLVLTFVIAILNPVTDCGCFGDALILTNWQTFWKNILFFVPTLIVFFQRDKFKRAYKPITEWGLIIFYSMAGILFSLYNYRNLPLIDFRPYHIGADVPEKMSRPEGSPVDEYEFSFIYEKNGEQKEFTVENLPDSTWNWVETKQKLIKKGYVPPIHDFSITSADGDDITNEVLSDPGYSFLVVTYKLEKANEKAFGKLNNLHEKFKDEAKFYCLTSSTNDVIQSFRTKNNSPFQFYVTDEITLKTIIRSNPGLVLLKEGTVIGKWHFRNVPDFGKNLLAFSLEQLNDKKENMFIYFIISGFLLFASVFHIVARKCKKQENEPV